MNGQTGRPRLLSDLDVVRAINLVRGGRTLVYVAKLFDVSEPTIRRVIKRPYKLKWSDFLSAV